MSKNNDHISTKKPYFVSYIMRDIRKGRMVAKKKFFSTFAEAEEFRWKISSHEKATDGWACALFAWGKYVQK